MACSWLVALTAPHWHGGTLTGVAPVAALALAALGEILLGPSLMALVNGLAPDGLVGRYNAFFNLAWQVGPIVGPAVAGVLIGRGLGGPFLIGLAAVCVLAANGRRTQRPEAADQIRGLRRLAAGPARRAGSAQLTLRAVSSMTNDVCLV